MFNTHFGLIENPFHVMSNQKFYYPSLSHTQAGNQLVENIRHREGLILLTGQTGTGKTLTIKRAINQLDPSTTAILYQNQPNTHGLMAFIQKSLGLDNNSYDQNHPVDLTSTDKNEPQQELNQLLNDIKTVDIDQLLNLVKQQTSLSQAKTQTLNTATQNPIAHYLHDQFRQGRNVVLFIDNVNNVEKNTLDTLLTLSQSSDELHSNQLQTIISCTPEIGAWLQKRYPNKECRLSPLQNQEVAPYIDYLLRTAGYADKFPFTSDATRKIAAHSQGIPSLVNYLCRSALFTASFEQQYTITADMIDAAAGSYVNQTNDEITFQPSVASSKRQSFNSHEFEYETPKQKPAIIRTDLKPKQKPVILRTDLKNQTSEPKTKTTPSRKTAQKRVIESISTTNPKRIKSTASVKMNKRIKTPIQHKTDAQQTLRAATETIKKKPAVVALKQNKATESRNTASQHHPLNTQQTLRPVAGSRKRNPATVSRQPRTSEAKKVAPRQHPLDTQRTLSPVARTRKTEVKPKNAALSKIVRSTGNDQTHEAWRLAVYDSLLLFITIGCVITLYQFNSKGIDKLSTSGDAFASWNELESIDESVSPLAKQVVLRIADLNPFNFNVMPALAARFFKNEGATTVNTVTSEAGTRTIIQGHFKNASGTTSTRIIELEPVSIHSKYKGMTTGRANIGISLAGLSAETLRSFQDKKQRTTPGEHTLALASVAIVVNSSNPAKYMSTEQVASIFQGKIRNWKLLGGQQGDIQVHTLKGKHEYLQNVLTQSLGNIKIVNTVQHDTPEHLARAIAKDRNSIGLVNIPEIGTMKALAISAEGQEPIQPSLSNINKSGYPLTQAIHAYALNTQSNTHTHKFLKFIHSNAAQTVFEKNGLAVTADTVSTATPLAPAITLQEFNDLTEQAQQLSSNIRFNSTMAILDDTGQRQIDRVTDLLKQLNLQENKLVILGYSYNSEFENTNKTISEERAETVAKAFEDRGITPAIVKGIGSWNPDRKITRAEVEISGDQLPQIQIWTNL